MGLGIMASVGVIALFLFARRIQRKKQRELEEKGRLIDTQFSPRDLFRDDHLPQNENTLI